MLVNENENVRLREAALTHQIQRKSHLELNMPYYTQTTDKLNEALAGMKVVEENGRLFVYDLEAEDAIVRQDRWASEFAVSMNLPRRPGIRYFGSEEERNAAATTSYAFRQAMKQMTSAQLENQLQPLVDEYFRKEFGGGPKRLRRQPCRSGLPTSTSFSTRSRTMARAASGTPSFRWKSASRARCWRTG